MSKKAATMSGSAVIVIRTTQGGWMAAHMGNLEDLYKNWETTREDFIHKSSVRSTKDEALIDGRKLQNMTNSVLGVCVITDRTIR